MSFDLDIMGLFAQLEAAGIAHLRERRGPREPPILLGGPVTASNVLPFGPFIDLAVIGDAEVALDALMDLLEEGLLGCGANLCGTLKLGGRIRINGNAVNGVVGYQASGQS